MSATFSTMANQVPAFAEARAKWDRWNHPAAKHERRKRRTSRAMTLWILLTILCGVLAVAAGLGWMSAAGCRLGPDLVCPETGQRCREDAPDLHGSPAAPPRARWTRLAPSDPDRRGTFTPHPRLRRDLSPHGER